MTTPGITVFELITTPSTVLFAILIFSLFIKSVLLVLSKDFITITIETELLKILSS